MSDPAIGRFWQVDPLAEDYVYNSPYAFQENKMGMGIELEGLELLGNDVAQYLILKGSVLSAKTSGARSQMGEALGNRVQARANGTEMNNNNSGFAGLNVSQVQDVSAIGDSANTISTEVGNTAMEVGRDTANVLEDTGDVVSTIGVATAQPEIVAVGEGLSGLGGAMNDTLDYIDGKPAGDIMIDRMEKMVVGRQFEKLTKKVENVTTPVTETALKVAEDVIINKVEEVQNQN